MSTSIQCFWAERTYFFVRELRRYTNSMCTGPRGYHSTSVKIDIIHRQVDEDQESGDSIQHSDARWPLHCDQCDYEFVELDSWQVNDHRLFRHPDTGQMFTLKYAPPGAMWDAIWFGETWKGPDGRHLVVKLPDETEWLVDGPDKSGNCVWSRSGRVPLVTATPSIRTDNYYGELCQGRLIPC